jgi:hypothetical protein
MAVAGHRSFTDQWVRFLVLTLVIMKITVFGDVAPFSLLYAKFIDVLEMRTASIIGAGTHGPDDWVGKHVLSVGKLLPEHAAEPRTR